MKDGKMGIVKLVLSIFVFILLDKFFFRGLALIGFKSLTGLAWTIANTIKYLLISLIVFVIYHSEIRSGQSRFNRQFLNSFIYCVACFVFLIVLTIILHEALNYIGNPRGIEIGYNFTNYFSQKFTISFALNLIVECAFMPFLLCVIFPLGFSNVFKKYSTASFIAGLTYGIYCAISFNSSFEYALYHAITPAVIIIMLTYLYKTNQNIWSVIVTYAFYVLFGTFAINYIV